MTTQTKIYLLQSYITVVNITCKTFGKNSSQFIYMYINNIDGSIISVTVVVRVTAQLQFQNPLHQVNLVAPVSGTIVTRAVAYTNDWKEWLVQEVMALNHQMLPMRQQTGLYLVNPSLHLVVGWSSFLSDALKEENRTSLVIYILLSVVWFLLK